METLVEARKKKGMTPEQAKEIKLTPVVESSNPVTKVPVLGSGGMVVGDMFLVSSYIAKSDNQHKGAFGNFFTNIPFLHTSNGWSGGQYWPFSHCVINFSAITKQLGSNRKVEIVWDEEHPASHAKGTLTGNDDNSQMDLMYGGTRGVYDENGFKQDGTYMETGEKYHDGYNAFGVDENGKTIYDVVTANDKFVIGSCSYIDEKF